MNAPLVTVGIVTWNSESVIERCLDAVRGQIHTPVELLVVDNASNDGTREILQRTTNETERIYLDRNTGFSAAHNLAIRRTHGEYYLTLNPDVFLSPAFVHVLIEALGADHPTGSATGKLLRVDSPDIIDSTGIYMTPNQRHLDRGSDQRDEGQYQRREYVFGASGAAAIYRRTMLEDIKIDGEYFDEDFFAYREDADLAWRAQLLGWRCLYVPEAVARHVRRVTPQRRDRLSEDVNRYSVRNRYLLRIKNQPLASAARFAIPTLWRDLQVFGYVLLREQSSLLAFVDVARLLPRMLVKRHHVMRRRRVRAVELDEWFRTRTL